MKEITDPASKDELKVKTEQQISTERKHLGRITPHKGHSLFEIDTKTLEVRLAQYEDVVAPFNTDTGKVVKKVLIKENCYYVSALNPANAMRKFYQGRIGGKFNKGK